MSDWKPGQAILWGTEFHGGGEEGGHPEPPVAAGKHGSNPLSPVEREALALEIQAATANFNRLTRLAAAGGLKVDAELVPLQEIGRELAPMLLVRAWSPLG